MLFVNICLRAYMKIYAIYTAGAMFDPYFKKDIVYIYGGRLHLHIGVQHDSQGYGRLMY